MTDELGAEARGTMGRGRGEKYSMTGGRGDRYSRTGGRDERRIVLGPAYATVRWQGRAGLQQRDENKCHIFSRNNLCHMLGQAIYSENLGHLFAIIIYNHMYCNCLFEAIFTESAHWADSVIESRCPSVCVCVCMCPLPVKFI